MSHISGSYFMEHFKIDDLKVILSYGEYKTIWDMIEYPTDNVEQYSEYRLSWHNDRQFRVVRQNSCSELYQQWLLDHAVKINNTRFILSEEDTLLYCLMFNIRSSK